MSCQKCGKQDSQKASKCEMSFVLDLKWDGLVEEEIEFFRENLDEEKIFYKVMEYWQTLFDQGS